MLSALAFIAFSPINIFAANETACNHPEHQRIFTLENGTKVAFDEKTNPECHATHELKKNLTQNSQQNNNLNKYYIAPEAGSTPNDTLPFNKAKIVKLEENHYYKIGNRDFISLGILNTHLGMDIILNEDRTIDILLKGERLATIYIDENKYADKEKITTLSAPPILVNSMDLSVPFDFFDTVLYTTIVRDRCGIITIIHKYGL